MSDTRLQIRPATLDDASEVADLASSLAQSFVVKRGDFDIAYASVLASSHAYLPVAAEDGACVGYLLGVQHPTFYANGPVAVVEEVLVRPDHRQRGVGRLLMSSLESWAAEHGCVLVSLATRRAAPFYRALGYAESAVSFRKVLVDRSS